MRKLYGLFVLLVVAVAVVVLFALPRQTPLAPVAAEAGRAASADQCTFVVAGRHATADGSVLMGYNNDWSADNFAYLKVVTPPDPSEYRYLRLLTWSTIPEGGLNERGLAVLYGVATNLAPEVLAADPYTTNGVGKELWDLLLKRCRTSREAVDLLERMAQTRGFTDDAAGSFAIGDSTEAWVFELLGGHHWVAARVPDDAYYVQPNMLRIRQIDLARPSRFRGSPDLEQFATVIGRYDPADGPFDVAWAYGDRSRLQSPYNTNRLWGVIDRFSSSLGLSTAMPYATRPVFVVPDHPLDRQDFMAVSREHYEGTALDQTGGYSLMSPHAQTSRPVCASTTDYGAVWQLRRGLPEAVRNVLWLALSRPCSSVFVPFYAGVQDVPQWWSQKRAYLAFRSVADDLDRPGTAYGEARYGHYIPFVRDAYGDFAAKLTAAQPSIEARAAALWSSSPAQAAKYLTDYSSTRAGEAIDLARGLAAQMP
jgi:dipeptidase